VFSDRTQPSGRAGRLSARDRRPVHGTRAMSRGLLESDSDDSYLSDAGHSVPANDEVRTRRRGADPADRKAQIPPHPVFEKTPEKAARLRELVLQAHELFSDLDERTLTVCSARTRGARRRREAHAPSRPWLRPWRSSLSPRARFSSRWVLLVTTCTSSTRCARCRVTAMCAFALACAAGRVSLPVLEGLTSQGVPPAVVFRRNVAHLRNAARGYHLGACTAALCLVAPLKRVGEQAETDAHLWRLDKDSFRTLVLGGEAGSEAAIGARNVPC
jgi:hypothetical protein